MITSLLLVAIATTFIGAYLEYYCKTFKIDKAMQQDTSLYNSKSISKIEIKEKVENLMQKQTRYIFLLAIVNVMDWSIMFIVLTILLCDSYQASPQTIVAMCLSVELLSVIFVGTTSYKRYNKTRDMYINEKELYLQNLNITKYSSDMETSI